MPSCTHKQSIPDVVLRKIPDSQGGSGRHKCIVCAYAQGLAASNKVAEIDSLGSTEECDHGSTAPTGILTALPRSQAEPGRHKCATCAFQSGFEAGTVAAEGRLKSDIDTEAAAHGGEEGSTEGKAVFRLSRTYERNPKNRRLAILAHGSTCAACGFNFDNFYGLEFARSYIEIHHINPLALRGEAATNPIKELRPLCANCHSMVHRDPSKVMSIEDLRALIEKTRKSST